ncbi:MULTISPECIES: heavy-metal-associated domain-containing protein [Aerococcus]|uniref:Heavy-metal-associated domain-containing protein n=1 Tax=Aerococcus sanguinicola TaxID=119206 RepID=A0A5N1GLV4_9LACT|nr:MULTISPECIES: heavy metal-associated domain-containing protein [Aerococcus]KAA9301268.1 heavy-metal-associated domain-containing protein [Aerococcus sanguinicola]MDK6369195.1 heavy metal-associated domain-containing protein [Aerococcus sp. UMB9870]MDK6679019.1 heavy metal-associated domain-containing protein [Aerococcus sp. UMB8608]MDK6687432.1 heavy metal-associated domain-containing protein [Aerococcus sp. UMB8623]MDK6940081.1 heavy metal-associated domain-containing protein [Aerococcus s
MTKTYQVSGLKCQGCKENVEQALSQVFGVESAEVDLDQKQVTVSGDYELADLKEALAGTNYQLEV